jgi:hypothetical protein
MQNAELHPIAGSGFAIELAPPSYEDRLAKRISAEKHDELSPKQNHVIAFLLRFPYAAGFLWRKPATCCGATCFKPGEPVFRSRSGKALERGRVRVILGRAAERADVVEGVSPHGLRVRMLRTPSIAALRSAQSRQRPD